MKYLFIIGVLLYLLLWMGSCRRVVFRTIRPTKPYTAYPIPPQPDYAYASNWYRYQKDSLRSCDVFFIHPTTSSFKNGWNTACEEPAVFFYTEKHSMQGQAQVFEKSCRIFAPKYRQATFYSFIEKNQNAQKAMDLAYADIKRAFEYYWAYENKGQRPFIIAGHSQGSVHGAKLLKELAQDTIAYPKLVLACLPGWPFIEDSLKHYGLNICTNSTDLHCVVSWNTAAKGAWLHLDKQFAAKGTVLCTNPVTWDTTKEISTKEKHLGARFLTPESKYRWFPHYLATTIKKKRLIISKPYHKKWLKHPLGPNNYHFYDYHFFYGAIQETVARRINSFYRKQE